MAYEMLLSPMKIGNLTVKNRVAMTAMAVEAAELDGKAGDRYVKYMEARAKGGVGLLITEIARVNEFTAIAMPEQLSMGRDEVIEPFKKVVDAVHAYDSKIFVQIHHAGRQNIAALATLWPMLLTAGRIIPNFWEMARPMLTKAMGVGMPLVMNNPKIANMSKYAVLPTVAPSNVPLDVSHTGLVPALVHPLTIPEIKRLEKQFIAAAVRVKKTGADGVELHGAHGYLIQQFLSPYTNQRHDMYGGSLENRMRFLLNIIKGVRKECGADFPISVRLGVDEFYDSINEPGKGLKLTEGIEIAKRLEKVGIDVLNISCCNYETPNTGIEPMSYAPGWRSYFVKAVTDAVNIPVIAVGVIRSPQQAEQMLQDGIQDFIGLGRPLLADPDWVKKAEEGRENDIQRCISCLACFQSLVDNVPTLTPVECAMNPKCCREVDYNDAKIPKDGAGRRVVVVGAGPAGLTAARELAYRDYKVTLLEKESEAGGQLNTANKPPHKEPMNWAIEDFTNRALNAGVEIVYNCDVTEDVLKKYDPYAVFIATGGVSGVPKSIPGADKENVCTAHEALKSQMKATGKDIVVVGSGLTGMETAEYFGEQGNRVTLVEMLDAIGPGVYAQLFYDIYPKLNEYGCRYLTSSTLTSIEDGYVVVKDANGAEVKPKADYVVFATGVKPVNDLEAAAKKVCSNVCCIGDASKTGTIKSATASAFAATLQLH